MCLSLGFATCKLVLKSNFDPLAPAVSKPHEIVFCQLGMCKEYSWFPIAETELYERSKQKTVVDQSLILLLYVSKHFVLLMESLDSGIYGGFMCSIYLILQM